MGYATLPIPTSMALPANNNTPLPSIQPPGISSTVPANSNPNVIVSNHNQSNGVAGNRNSYQQGDYSRDMSRDQYMEWY